MSTYITHYKWITDENIEFKLNTGKVFNYKYKKYSSEERYYLHYDKGLNNTLIRELGIADPYEWAETVLGYKLCDNGWPEAKSKDDLLKLITSLCKFNNPKYCIKEDFIVEDYPVLPSEVLSFYNEDKNEVTFKDLNITYILYKSVQNIFWWKPLIGIDESFIFKSLKIKDKNKWVKDIQGYELSAGTTKTAFPESKTKEDAYKVMDALIAEYIKQFQPKTTIKTNNYGDSKIELRRKKADVRVGSCPAGNIVYGKRSKASVRSRRVSYQTCIGN